MSIVRARLAAAILALVASVFIVPGFAADSPPKHAAKHAKRPKMTTDIPSSLTIPPSVDTPIGTLNFKDGVPDEDTAQKAYDNLDFQRAVQAFLDTQQAASLAAMRKGIHSAGGSAHAALLFGDLLDSKSLFLTANTDTVYATAWIDLHEGPVVVEVPPHVLGLVDDFWFHYVTDIGLAGPDGGKGAKYLFVPPGYSGEVPAGYYVSRPRTFGNWLILRGFTENGNPRPAAANMRKLRIFALAKADKPPPFHFVNVTGKAFNTIQASDASFFEQVNEVVQEEPAEASDPETLGVLASIGIVKGQPFAPDARMRKILGEAATVGQATLRSMVYRNRDKAAKIYPDGSWVTGFIGGSSTFEHNGVRLLDPRSMFFFMATGITPAMSEAKPGMGSQYAANYVDAHGQMLDGGKSYRVHLPSGIPAKNFWSLVVYDTQTRSELQTDQRLPGIGSQKQGLAKNGDGSVDVHFGPTAPKGKGVNWVQTLPGKGWFVILRLYGPTEGWFEKSWRPGEVEEE
ncbi:MULTISPECIES: DUF1254 domain-containing protein [Dyella]|uniref:DUF1254 domain-containing protein n=2 Tax=Dyella TaxID=231454 RepID=A0A4R0YLX1_9GAMM|nr:MULTISPECIES: DUF1254 domain-containing protein [Dyella]TBR35985.1 DUF1254 domain-containing protein [Dyella terrae]TCI08468.1 DUF1254 domain-containing protein [Dyella soli]